MSVVLSLVLSLLPRAAEAALDQEALELVWYDEFAGGSVDWDKWVVDEGDGCDINLCDWGNGEKQVFFFFSFRFWSYECIMLMSQQWQSPF